MKLRNILPTLMGLEAISVSTVNEVIANNQITVLDVNTRQSWAKAHVPGALHLDATKYTESELPADKTSTLVFYCSNPICRKAPNAARKAKKMGYTNVKIMSEGISGWLSSGFPTEGES